MELSERDQTELQEKLEIITDGMSRAYIIYRMKMLLEHAMKQADERAYIRGWNDALANGPERMKPVKRKTYGFRDV